MRKVVFFPFMLSLCLFISCSSQPKLIGTNIEPEFVAPGDSVHLSIEFSGNHTDMKEVYLTVREYPYDYPMIKMRQKSQSKLNLWFEDLIIPYEAYPGEYHMDINAFLKDGKEIITKGFEDNSTGKTGTLILKVK